MRFFYDCEFIEDGRTIDLVSIGVVDENGREFYAVSTEFDGTTSTSATSGSSKHSRSAPCPTIPVAPNKMTFNDFSGSRVQVYSAESQRVTNHRNRTQAHRQCRKHRAKQPSTPHRSLLRITALIVS